MSRKVLVGGASGFIGSAVCRAFIHAGYSVAAVSRSPPRHSFFHQALSWEQLADAGKVDAVVNCSGENVLNPLKRWGTEFEEKCRSSRLDTAAQLGQFAKSVGAGKFVQVTGIHACPTGLNASEGEAKGEGEYAYSDSYWGKFVEQWENAARENFGEDRLVCVRPGAVLGREGGAFPQMRLQFLFGLGGVQGSGEQLFPWIHIEDLANVIRFSVEQDQVNGAVHAVAPQTITNKDLTTALGTILRRPTLLPTPKFVFNLIFGSPRIELLFDNPKVIPKKLVENGFKFKYGDIESALKSLV
jgi:uncharacterized protein (TIGR01777 family)